MDVARVRNAGTPPPSPSPVDRQVRTLHPGTIFAWEGYCFYDSIRPLAIAFAVTATVAGAKKTLTLAAVANPATGEKVGATSQFENTADWLKSPAPLTGTRDSLTIRDNTFKSVPFTLPAAKN